MAEFEKKKIQRKYDKAISQSAGTRNSNGVDTETSFGIPGSGLPRRHCNVNINVTVVVCSDLTVYISLHDGTIDQKVYGRKYACKMFVCPHPFNMTIPRGVTGWGATNENVNFTDPTNNNKDCTADVRCIVEGSLEKSYDVSVPFQWKFGPCQSLAEKQEYMESHITQAMPYEVQQNGGFSKADSHFVNVGHLTDYSWTKNMGASQDGCIYLCGGILYPGSRITSEIIAAGVKVEIPGLNLASYYFPGDIRKGERMSLNRPEGHLQIYSPSLSPEYLDWDGSWRDVKNTENENGVDNGVFDNYGYRLEGDEWVRLIITGKGGVPEDQEEGGVGSDDPSSSGNGGGCPYCTRGG